MSFTHQQQDTNLQNINLSPNTSLENAVKTLTSLLVHLNTKKPKKPTEEESKVFNNFITNIQECLKVNDKNLSEMEKIKKTATLLETYALNNNDYNDIPDQSIFKNLRTRLHLSKIFKTFAALVQKEIDNLTTASTVPAQQPQVRKNENLKVEVKKATFPQKIENLRTDKTQSKTVLPAADSKENLEEKLLEILKDSILKLPKQDDYYEDMDPVLESLKTNLTNENFSEKGSFTDAERQFIDFLLSNINKFLAAKHYTFEGVNEMNEVIKTAKLSLSENFKLFNPKIRGELSKFFNYFSELVKQDIDYAVGELNKIEHAPSISGQAEDIANTIDKYYETITSQDYKEIDISYWGTLSHDQQNKFGEAVRTYKYIIAETNKCGLNIGQIFPGIIENAEKFFTAEILKSTPSEMPSGTTDNYYNYTKSLDFKKDFFEEAITRFRETKNNFSKLKSNELFQNHIDALDNWERYLEETINELNKLCDKLGEFENLK